MRPLRFIYEWLLKLRWLGVEDQIGLQGLEYDEESGELRPKQSPRSL